MAAVYDRWHLGQKDALERVDSREQKFTVPAPELEKARAGHVACAHGGAYAAWGGVCGMGGVGGIASPWLSA